MYENNALLCEYGSEIVKGLLVRVYWNKKAYCEKRPELLLYVRQDRDSRALWIQIANYGLDDNTIQLIYEEASEYLDAMSEEVADVQISLSDGRRILITVTSMWYRYIIQDAYDEAIACDRRYYPGLTVREALAEIKDRNKNLYWI